MPGDVHDSCISFFYGSVCTGKNEPLNIFSLAFKLYVSERASSLSPLILNAEHSVGVTLMENVQT